MKYDIFISYSTADRKEVETICAFLGQRGLRCFVAYRDVPRGIVWAKAIVEALEESRMMVVVFSENFNRSDQVDRELELAIEDSKPILTFRLSDTKFEGAKKYYLKNLNWIDGFNDPEVALNELYENICRLLSLESKSLYKTTPNQKDKSQYFTPIDDSDYHHSEYYFDVGAGEFRQGIPSNSTAKSIGREFFINGHEYVDLGLPSGLKWATCNVGADQPQMYGDYFAWGETIAKMANLKEDTASYGKDNFALKSCGIIDSRGELSHTHDVAHLKWGPTWRTPTREEMEELLNNTVSKYTQIKGINGLRLTSKINGKTLFLPAVGWQEGLSIKSEGKEGCYWSSTPDENDSFSACSICFYSGEIKTDWSPRNYGFGIRPVSE